MLELLLVLKKGKGVVKAPQNGFEKHCLGRMLCHLGWQAEGDGEACGGQQLVPGTTVALLLGQGESMRWENNFLHLRR